MTEGKLVVVNNKTLQVQFINSKGKSVQFNVKESELSAALMDKRKNAIAELNGLEVEFEVIGGQPQKIREKGQSFQSHNLTTAPSKETDYSSSVKSSRDNRPNSENSPGDFHNPYNFVPALPRNSERFTTDLAKELGDRPPAPQGVYCSDRWSGKITVTLTTKTPLLIPDATNAHSHPNNSDHKIYSIRCNSQNQPYLPPTSIKGMLRSAYEAVTNSRLSVFKKKHENRLAYRMPTSMGLEMVPARVESNSNGQKVIRLFPGTSSIGANGKPEPNLMFAAWLPRYYKGNISRDAVRYPNNQLPEHKHEVEVWLEKFQHWRWERDKKDRKKGRHIEDFQYWRVREIVRFGDSLRPKQPHPTSNRGKSDCEGYSYHESLGEFRKVHGFVCITEPNIDRKHDERVFFGSSDKDIVHLSEEEVKALEKQWRNLITDYQEIHKDEICKQRKSSPPVLKNSVWSRHIKGNGFTLADDERELKVETLCYARVQKINGNYQVLGLYPVIIAKELFAVDPQSLLSQELKPATDIKKLSPADRVFGWVRQGSDHSEPHSSYKGNLRISTVECVTENAIERFPGRGLPLAILGEPKPQQTRFYAARDKFGFPLAKGANKEEGYQDENKGLRGRKVYPHHRALPTGYWDAPMNPAQNLPNDYYREYRQIEGEGQITDQNRSIQEWVKPGTQFKLEINVTNLSNVELGALLWLLDLPDEHFHRLGGGKPLGFGSVQLKIDWEYTDLRTGTQWKEFYRSLLPLQQTLSQPQTCKQLFQQAVAEAYSHEFEQVPFIAAFLRCAKGFDDQLPIHYPRLQQKPTSEGKVFEWFVANERSGRNGGQKLPLPELIHDQGLPRQPFI